MSTPNVDLSRAEWRKSTRSTAEGPNCVEVAAIGTDIAVRDSKNPASSALLFQRAQWRRFIRAFKATTLR